MKKIFISLLIFLIILLLSCSQNNDLEYEDINPKLTNLISDKYVNQIRYSVEDFEQILAASKECGIVNPYIPTSGVGTDYVIEIRETKDLINIVFPHFSLTQSLKNIIPAEGVIEEREVELKIGNAKWIGEQNNSQNLYIKISNVFICISTAKPYDEEDFENIIESLVPLINDSN